MRRIPELDGVRGIAALAIVLFHWRFHLPFLRTAVDLFFVLSGYLITSILLHMAGTPHAFRTFYARRAFRIFPIYYLTFAVFLVINRFIPRPQPIDALPYFLTYTQYIQGYWRQSIPPFAGAFGHTWTLAIEEQFYLFWPFVVWAVGRKGLPVVALALIGLASWLRFSGIDSHLLFTRCDGLVLGAVLGAVLSDGERLERHRSALGIGFALVAIVALMPIGGMGRGPVWNRFVAGVWFAQVALFYTGLIGLVILHAGHPWLRPLRADRLCRLGKMSYGLYMYHIPIFFFVNGMGRWYGYKNPVQLDVLKLVATFAVASLSWRFVEQPILALKERWSYPRMAHRIEDSTDGALRIHTGSAEIPPSHQPRIRVDERASRCTDCEGCNDSA